MHTHRFAALTVMAALALGGCGDDDGGGSEGSAGAAATEEAPSGGAYGGGSSSGAGAGAELKLTADPDGGLTFDPTELEAESGKVAIVMDNPSGAGIPHAVGIKGGGADEEGEVAEPGGTSEVSATLDPGTYTFYCPVPGHEEGGMTGTLTVR